MKKIFITLALCVIFSLFVYDYSNADAFKWIRIGRFQDRIVDSINQGESISGRWMYYYYDDFRRENTQQSATYLFCTNWTDHNGTLHPIKQTGVGGGRVDELTVTMPVPDAEDITIRTYYRNAPPTITVDGWRIEEFFPQPGEEVAPDKIPGSADIMVESTVNTDMGVTISQKVLAWSQMNHDDYHIYDWTFTNTGNVDLDDEIELQGQTINDFYIWRATRFGPARIGRRYKNWYSRYGEHPTDSLRIRYAYSARRSSASFDDVGYPSTSRQGWLNHPEYAGEATLYVQKDPDDISDWEMQPSVSGNGNCDVVIANWLWYQLSSDDIATQYSVFTQGFDTKVGKWDNVMQTEGIWPGTKHSIRMDEQGLKWVKDNHFYTWHPWTGHSSGPWDLEFGESIRYVYSKVIGSISQRLGWDVGNAWFNGEAEPPPGMVYGVTDNMPPQYTVHPDLYDDANDWAKDCWVFTGKDSLFKNANASQWAFTENYEVPTAPAAPSIVIKSLPDKIRIEWDGTESEKATDFAGYRIYRAVPVQYSTWWERIADISGSGTYQYDDATASRGVGYAYYVTAYDNGFGNLTDVNGRKEVLESGMYFNETSLRKASLTRPPSSTLSDIRVVPNPFNITLGEADMHYPGDKDKIMFLDLPGYCTIKIYTESVDLIKTLYHTDGSGDEAWGDIEEEYSATDDGQIIVSGIYIALIEENNVDGAATGNTHFVKFVIIR